MPWAVPFDLPHGHHRMNGLADFGDRRDVERRDFTCDRIDLQLDDIAAPGVAAVGIARICLVAPVESRRRLVLRGHGERAVLAEILRRGEPTKPLAHVTRAALEELPHDHAAA